MTLHIGSEKYKIMAGKGKIFVLNSTVIASKLKTEDGFLLKDENNLFLTSKKEDK